MGIIRLHNIRVFAYHGCLSEEAKIGSNYTVDLWVEANLEKPSRTDKLGDTIDYVKLNKIVKGEMSQRSNLLENAARRILIKILNEFSEAKHAGVRVSKINPPTEGDVENVSVELSQGR